MFQWLVISLNNEAWCSNFAPCLSNNVYPVLISHQRGCLFWCIIRSNWTLVGKMCSLLYIFLIAKATCWRMNPRWNDLAGNNQEEQAAILKWTRTRSISAISWLHDVMETHHHPKSMRLANVLSLNWKESLICLLWIFNNGSLPVARELVRGYMLHQPSVCQTMRWLFVPATTCDFKIYNFLERWTSKQMLSFNKEGWPASRISYSKLRSWMEEESRDELRKAGIKAISWGRRKTPLLPPSRAPACDPFLSFDFVELRVFRSIIGVINLSNW